MFCEIVLLCSLFKSTSHRLITGKHFVVGCPWVQEYCEALILTTEYTHVQISISEVHDNTMPSPKYFRVEQKLRHRLTLYEPHEHDHNSLIPAASCRAWVIESSAPVKILIFAYVKKEKSIGMIHLTPKRNCYKTYYAITKIGQPFLTIMSFNYSQTNLTITFPYGLKDFNLNCNANITCQPGKSVKVRLSPYQIWYFVAKKSLSLSNVKIEADNPINVVSGNLYGANGQTSTSLKPMTTWGKTYIVASLYSDVKTFLLTTGVFPLTVTFHTTTEKGAKHNTVTHLVESVNDLEFVYGETAKTLAVTAEIPFGLYQWCGSIDESIINLIPIEQWLHGSFYIDPGLDILSVTTYLITQALKHEVYIENLESDHGNETVSMIWHEWAITIYDKSYRVAELRDYLRIRIHTSIPYKKVIVYCLVKGDSQGVFPFDFYQGEIYQSDCQKTKQLFSDDGVDNDCDDHIDEEIRDGKDNDGDGLIDEDYIDKYSDGKWSEWSRGCDQTCNGKTMSVRTRACTSRSTFGKHCPGSSIQCDGKACPLCCDFINRSATDCLCNAMCLTCRDSIFECDGCKSGYMPSRHCKTSCPKGRTGIACTELKEDADDRGCSLREFFQFTNIAGCLLWYLLLLFFVLTIIAFGTVASYYSVIPREKIEEEEGSRDHALSKGESSLKDSLDDGLDQETYGKKLYVRRTISPIEKITSETTEDQEREAMSIEFLF